jgi:glycyl-tRNA synthetase alpha chain
VYDIEWAPGVSYRDVRFADEVQFSVYNFEMADVGTLWKLFDLHEGEAARLLGEYRRLEKPLPDGRGSVTAGDKSRFPLLPTYEHVLKCSHLFNTLDARGAISVTERVAVIARVRKLAVGVAASWVSQQTVGELVEAAQ